MKKEKFVTTCCNATPKTSRGSVTTKFWICTKCNKPCDIKKEKDDD